MFHHWVTFCPEGNSRSADDDGDDEGEGEDGDDDDEGEDDEKPSWGAIWVFLPLTPRPRWEGAAMAWFLSSLPRALVDRRDEDDDDDGEHAEDEEDEEGDDEDDEDEGDDEEEEEEEARVINEAVPPRIVSLRGRGRLAGVVLFKVLTTTFELRRSGCCRGAE